jgi:hypothetical protein
MIDKIKENKIPREILNNPDILRHLEKKFYEKDKVNPIIKFLKRIHILK